MVMRSNPNIEYYVRTLLSNSYMKGIVESSSHFRVAKNFRYDCNHASNAYITINCDLSLFAYCIYQIIFLRVV